MKSVKELQHDRNIKIEQLDNVGGGRATMGSAFIIFSREMDWDHVSISYRNRCPTWDEMCKVKKIFWEEEDAVIQIHPPKSQYVNNYPYCLHLWKPTKENLPLPPSIMVGLKNWKIEE